ncbi:MAG: hypothetical protein KGI33_05040 [Thaumarchaeota archaeon]|nr:hypothetical protein [Nitrososphaerota archaeon]
MLSDAHIKNMIDGKTYIMRPNGFIGNIHYPNKINPVMTLVMDNKTHYAVGVDVVNDKIIGIVDGPPVGQQFNVENVTLKDNEQEINNTELRPYVSKIMTRDYGTNDVFSLIFIKNNYTIPIDSIILLQHNSDVKVLSAWIASTKWNSITQGELMKFSSNMTNFLPNKTLVIQIITDKKDPIFELKNATGIQHTKCATPLTSEDIRNASPYIEHIKGDNCYMLTINSTILPDNSTLSVLHFYYYGNLEINRMDISQQNPCFQVISEWTSNPDWIGSTGNKKDMVFGSKNSSLTMDNSMDIYVKTKKSGNDCTGNIPNFSYDIAQGF